MAFPALFESCSCVHRAAVSRIRTQGRFRRSRPDVFTHSLTISRGEVADELRFQGAKIPPIPSSKTPDGSGTDARSVQARSIVVDADKIAETVRPPDDRIR